MRSPALSGAARSADPLLDRLSRLPAVPVSGSGRALYQPVWAEDVADAVMAALSNGASGSYDLAGPQVLSYDDIVRTALRASGRRRRLLHVPLPVIKPNESNPMGFFESTWPVKFHRRLLERAFVEQTDGRPLAQELAAAVVDDVVRD